MPRSRWYQNGTLKVITLIAGFVLNIGTLIGVVSYHFGKVEEKLNSIQKQVAKNEKSIEKIESWFMEADDGP